MGAFNINITGVGGHGCERKAKPGDKLHGRCGRFTCPDCAAYDFTQRLRQAGMLTEGGTAQGQELKDGETPPEGAEVYELPVAGSDAAERGVTIKRYWKKPHQALFTHWPGEPNQVVDDMLKNERKSGQF
jgi:hypothetical protein